MKVFFSILVFLCFHQSLQAQFGDIDSLKRAFGNSKNDTLKLVLAQQISYSYSELRPDSSMSYAEISLSLAKKLKLRLSQANALTGKGYALMNMANYSGSLKTFLEAKSIAEDSIVVNVILPKEYLIQLAISGPYTPQAVRRKALIDLYFFLSTLYENTNNHEQELHYLRRGLQNAKESGDSAAAGGMYYIMGRLYLTLNRLDSALLLEEKARVIGDAWNTKDAPWVLLTLGKIHLARGEQAKAVGYLRWALTRSKESQYLRGVVVTNLLLSDICKMQGKSDSSYYYAYVALSVSKQLNIPDLLLRSDTTLAGLYKSARQDDSTVKYQSLVIKLKDGIFNSNQQRQFQNIDFEEQQRRQEIETTRKTYRDQLRTLGLLAAIVVFLTVAIFLWRNNRQRQKAYSLLQRQKRETDLQKAKVERALEDLTSAQAQLVHSEKMASLGELTAGIAHEIQNPLNFVNNFSEVNTELIDEMQTALRGGQFEAALNLSGNIRENESKIKLHGQRADAIVKSMLQHSHASTGQKEVVDINNLAAEYLRLSYNGIRAKDKSFKASVETEFDPELGTIRAVPQEIARTLLNIYNNAFYAVNERRMEVSLNSQASNYEPKVLVRTQRIGEKVEIRVKDNGNGISKKVLGKIFQPFFTTKPTGSGTGLGLSIAFDTITNGHDGNLSVETEEGGGAEFIIQLPIGA